MHRLAKPRRTPESILGAKLPAGQELWKVTEANGAAPRVTIYDYILCAPQPRTGCTNKQKMVVADVAGLGTVLISVHFEDDGKTFTPDPSHGLNGQAVTLRGYMINKVFGG